MNKDSFIEHANSVHHNKFIYSKVKYIDYTKTKVTIICPIHGEFHQTPRRHLNSSGCYYCSGYRSDFISKAIKKYKNKFDYSKCNYINSKTRVTIICPIHGEFTQLPQSHLKGKGCPKCHLNSLRKTTEQFINKAIKIHGNKYDYSKSEYTRSLNKIKIICPIHGEFEQIASDHINNKKGCIKCYLENNSKGLKDFIQQSHLIHDHKYDYSLIKRYHNNMHKVPIMCPKHGIFYQRPYQHTIKKHGCPACQTTISKPHQEIVNYINSLSNYQVEINNRKVISNTELDIWIPSKRLAIEYNGLFWHSYNTIETTKERQYHKRKSELCDEKGIDLFQIWEHEWTYQKELIKSMIKSKLDLNNKIYALDCKIVILDKRTFNEFLKNNHMQNNILSSIRYGLTYNNELVYVAGLAKHVKYEWKLNVFSNKKHTDVVNGIDKLLNHFIKNNNPKSIMAYDNRNYNNKTVYDRLGFKLLEKTYPEYYYTKNGIVYTNLQFKKNKLKNKLKNFDQSLSEAKNMFNNGYRRFWDAGKLRYALICKK